MNLNSEIKTSSYSKGRWKLYLIIICIYLAIIVCVQFYIIFNLQNEVNRYKPFSDPDTVCEVYKTEQCCEGNVAENTTITIHQVWKRSSGSGVSGTCPTGCVPKKRRRIGSSVGKNEETRLIQTASTTSSPGTTLPGYSSWWYSGSYTPTGTDNSYTNYPSSNGYTSYPASYPSGSGYVSYPSGSSYSYGYPSGNGYTSYPSGSSYNGGGGLTGYSSWYSSGGLPGMPGPPGLPGDPGWPGSPGDVGEPGSPGDSGWPGSPGEAGWPGSPGHAGLPGPPGMSGSPGSPGLPGSPGSTGPRGPSGAAGSPGYVGLPGSTGSVGLPGQRGSQGVQGPSGSRGYPGVTFQNGYTGTNGLQQGYLQPSSSYYAQGHYGSHRLPGRGDQTPTEETYEFPKHKNETEISEVLKELRLLDHPKCKDEVDHKALMQDLKNKGKVSFMILVDLADSVYCIVHA